MSNCPIQLVNKTPVPKGQMVDSGPTSLKSLYQGHWKYPVQRSYKDYTSNSVDNSLFDEAGKRLSYQRKAFPITDRNIRELGVYKHTPTGSIATVTVPKPEHLNKSGESANIMVEYNSRGRIQIPELSTISNPGPKDYLSRHIKHESDWVFINK
jgi:hypothetical protein